MEGVGNENGSKRAAVTHEGRQLGTLVGISVGSDEGTSDGSAEGTADGSKLGSADGEALNSPRSRKQAGEEVAQSAY